MVWDKLLMALQEVCYLVAYAYDVEFMVIGRSRIKLEKESKNIKLQKTDENTMMIKGKDEIFWSNIIYHVKKIKNGITRLVIKIKCIVKLGW